MADKSRLNKRAERETNPSALRPTVLRVVDRRIIAQGEIDLPCIPALLDPYVTKLLGVWEALGKPFADDERASLRDAVQRALTTGFEASPYARMVVTYEASAQAGVRYAIRLKENSIEEHYQHWLTSRQPPLFGKWPDTKVMQIASDLGDPASAPVLDVGAGTGRNALPLARRGHPTDALELVPELAEEMRKAASQEGLPVEVIEGDVLSPELALKAAHYKLVVLSEVTSHFRDLEELRTVFGKFRSAVVPGGFVVVSAFLAMDGYKPDALVRQVSETAWSRVFTRAELGFITSELPFDRITDESAHDHEKHHLPSEAWPPTGWFVDWSSGRNVFDLPAGKVPMELRWLVYRRRP